MGVAFETTDVAAGDLGRYDDFLAASPQGTLFAGARWLELLARRLPGRVFALAFVAGGEVRALVPVWEKRLSLVGPYADIPPLTPYWGPCLPPTGELRPERLKARDHETLTAVAADFKRRWPYARLACHPTLADVRPFTWERFAAETRYTSVLAPSPPDDFLASLPAALRNKIKNAASARVEESADARPFVAMYERTFTRQRMRPPAPPAFVADLAATFLGAGAALYYIYGEDGEPAAARLVLRDGRAAYDLLAASVGEPGPLGAALLWHEIRAAWTQGLALDLVGVNVPAIARFKESFGGRLVPYQVLAYYRSPVTRLAVAYGRRGAR